MARRKVTANPEFVLFNVVYADGSRSSNRRVPAAVLGGLDGDAPARAVIEDQDRKVSELSGRPRQMIASITRAERK